MDASLVSLPAGHCADAVLVALHRYRVSFQNPARFRNHPQPGKALEYIYCVRHHCFFILGIGNKIGMAIGTALLAGLLGKYGYVANQTQNAAVLSIMKHAFTTIPGVLWIVTAVVLFFYRLNKKRYNEIVEELKNGKRG